MNTYCNIIAFYIITVKKIRNRWEDAQDTYRKVKSSKNNRCSKKMQKYIFLNGLSFLDKLENVQKATSLDEKPYNYFENDEQFHNDSMGIENSIIKMLHNEFQNSQDDDVSFFNSIMTMVGQLEKRDKILFKSAVIDKLLSFQHTQNISDPSSNTLTV